MDPWRTPEKVLTGHLCDQMAEVTGDPRAPTSPATRDQYLQIADQPFRRQRKAVSAWRSSGYRAIAATSVGRERRGVRTTLWRECAPRRSAATDVCPLKTSRRVRSFQ